MTHFPRVDRVAVDVHRRQRVRNGLTISDTSLCKCPMTWHSWPNIDRTGARSPQHDAPHHVMQGHRNFTSSKHTFLFSAMTYRRAGSGTTQDNSANNTTMIAMTITNHSTILTICTVALITQANSGGWGTRPSNTRLIANTAAITAIQINRCSTAPNEKHIAVAP